MSVVDDPLAALRLFAEMRRCRLALIGLDTPDKKKRAKMIQDPTVFKALIELLRAAESLVANPDENALFWHPERETYGEAEVRFDQIRRAVAQGSGA